MKSIYILKRSQINFTNEEAYVMSTYMVYMENGTEYIVYAQSENDAMNKLVKDTHILIEEIKKVKKV